MKFEITETYQIKEWEPAYYNATVYKTDSDDELTASEIEDVKAYIREHGLGEYAITLNGVEYMIEFDDDPFDYACNSDREKTDEPTKWDIEESEENVA